MATKVDLSSPIELRRGQSSASSTVSASSPKVSMFGVKSGFVIPKNKLSGSLVPIFRGGSKVDAGSNVKEESIKQVQRKTKWGVDLTQDAAVRKGRASAYQIRVEQIAQQLKSGALEIGDDQGSKSPKQDSTQQSATGHVDQKANKLELLELEKREIIGEILRLNPSYKAPPDYKPLLKEGKVPIPVKAYPGYNFIDLLLGPESNTQKRLEEETGAKIRVYGTKANTKEKREITLSDVTEVQGAYEELYVNVSADTFDKVDAAVSLIELLVTPVSGNAAVASKTSTSFVGDNMNIYHQTRKDPSGYVMATVADFNQVLSQSMLVSAPSGQLQFQQQHSATWFPIASTNAPPRPATGFLPFPTPINILRFPPSGGPPYLQPTSFSSVPRTSSHIVNRSQLLSQAMQQPPPTRVMPPQNQAMSGQQSPAVYHVPAQLNPNPPASFPASRPVPLSPSRPSASINQQPGSMARPLVSMPTHSGNSASRPVPLPPSRPSASINQQPGSMARPLVSMPTHSGNSSGWSSAPPIVPSPQRANMTQMAPQPFNLHVKPQQSLLSPQPSMPNNVVRPPSVNFTHATFPSQPTIRASFTPVPPQIGPMPVPAAASSSSGAPLQAPISPLASMSSNTPSLAPRPFPAASAAPAPMPQNPVSHRAPSLSASASTPALPMAPQSLVQVMTRPPVPVPSVASGLAQPQLQTPQPPLASTPSNIPNFSPIMPPTTSLIGAPPVPAPKPLRPSSGDFTFRPLKAQAPASPTAPRPNILSIAQNISPLPLGAPQAPSFWPASQNATPPVGMQSVPPSVAANQLPPTQVPLLPSPTLTLFPTNSNQAPILPNPTTTPFPANTTARPPRFPFPNSNTGPPTATQMGSSRPMAPSSQMGPSNFSPAPRAATLASGMPARPLNFLQPHHNQLPPANRAGGLISPNQQVGSNQHGSVSGQVLPTSGGSQFYDPFSPMSISSAPPQQGGEHLKAQKQETDAEYEDLMASVGVK